MTISATVNNTTANFKSAKADIGGVQIHYQLGGDPNGAPILLWHGFLSTSYAWRKVMTVLADAGYSVLVPDMRGFGDSDKPEKGLGAKVGEMISLVAENVTKHVFPDSGHFLPEERPDEIVRQIYAVTGKPLAKQATTAAASKINE